ncbi:hypothetical protein MJ565_10740 [Klebsiella pneumoniae]|nr:hypothetical protein MJ565_10740 [Klebsiella pneumoniae]
MPEQYRYSLPVKAGDQRQLGELTGVARCQSLVAEMAERHNGPVVLVAPDMQTRAASERRDQAALPDSMVMGLADWETPPYDSFSPHQDSHLLPSLPPFTSYPPWCAAC